MLVLVLFGTVYLLFPKVNLDVSRPKIIVLELNMIIAAVLGVIEGINNTKNSSYKSCKDIQIFVGFYNW